MEPTKEINEIEEQEMLKHGSQVLLLRHANSQYNYEFSQMEKYEYSDEDYKTLRIKKDLRDAHLSKLGIKQCERAQGLANQLKVDSVLVSPLRRAMETAYHVFKNHPSFDNIKFIVVPKLREAVDTAWDIPVNILDTVEEYKTKFKNLDVSLLKEYGDVSHYFLRDINQPFAKKILSVKQQDSEDPMGSNAFDLLLEYINVNYPVKSESKKNILNRISKVKEYVKNILETNKIDEDSKVVWVGHSYYFKMWTGKWERDIKEYDEIPEPKEFTWLQNWQFTPDNVNFPRKL